MKPSKLNAVLCTTLLAFLSACKSNQPAPSPVVQPAPAPAPGGPPPPPPTIKIVGDHQNGNSKAVQVQPNNNKITWQNTTKHKYHVCFEQDSSGKDEKVCTNQSSPFDIDAKSSQTCTVDLNVVPPGSKVLYDTMNYRHKDKCGKDGRKKKEGILTFNNHCNGCEIDSQ